MDHTQSSAYYLGEYRAAQRYLTELLRRVHANQEFWAAKDTRDAAWDRLSPEQQASEPCPYNTLPLY